MNPSVSRSRTFWILAALLALAAYVRFRALAFGLPFTQARPDETFVIEAARTLLSARLPRFFDYPWLYIWLVSFGYVWYFVWGAATGAFQSIAEMVASWPTYWEPFFLIPRVISATAGTLTVLVVYRLGRQLRDETTGLVSALFLSGAFIHARDSHFGTTDATMTLLIVGAVSLLMDAYRTDSRRTFAVASLTAGLAAATKYNAVVLLAPMAVVYLLRSVERSHGAGRAWLDTRLLLLALPFVLGFGIGMPFVILDHEQFLLAMRELVRSMQVGDPRLGLTNGWLHHLEFSLRYGLGLPLLIAGIAGVPVLLRAQPRLGAVFLAFPVAYYMVAGSIRNLFFRYTLPMVPFLCVTAAVLVTWGVSALFARGRIRATSGRGLELSMVAVVALTMAWPSMRSVWALDRVLAATDNRVVVEQYFADHVPAGSSLLQSGSRFGHVRFAGRLGYKEWRWDGGRNTFMLDGARPSGRPDWILLQSSPLPSATQEIVTAYLREGYATMAEFQASTLDADIVYDRQDAFFVPFTGLDRVVRPGPNFTLFKRNDSAVQTLDPRPTGR